MIKDKKTRSISKTISWRIIATITTALLVFVFTHKWELALTIGGLEGGLKLLFYYLHERVWDNIAWGTLKSSQKK